MTRSKTPFAPWMAAGCGIALWFVGGAALADPPGRVARLAQINGAVSFSPAGEENWVIAQPNSPLITGDRVWSDSGSRAEIEIGSAAARLGSTTSVTLLNLDDRMAQIDLAQGTLDLRIRRIYPEQVYEIDTPNLAFSIQRAGDYRIDVDTAGNATIVRVRSGEGQVWGEGAAYTIGAGQQATFSGEGLRDYSFDAMSAPDEFDNWCFDRNRREDSAVAGRYVSPDVVGYSDLDAYGAWRSVDGYGNVWFPTAVAADWVPYRSGHWAWVDPWGWTWVDDAPWGFAPFHYGRWAYVSTRWCWVPGPIAVRPVYAPALVAFVGGAGFSLALSTGAVAGIAWFPLGPGDVYRPAYAASQSYFTSVNVSNTVINTTVINNVYNNNVTNIVYRNRELPGAVTAVPTTTFSGAQPVAGHVVAVTPAMLAREPVGPVASITPTRASVLAVGAVAAGAAAVAIAHRPPAAVLARPVVARTPPPPPPPAFSAKASLLAAHPGTPLEAERLKTLQPARSAELSRVKVVAPSGAPQPLSKSGAGKAARSERAAVPQPAGRNAQPSAGVPQPPASVQERTLQDRKAAAQGTGVGQPPSRTLQEHKAPPAGAGAPQPPASAQERMKQERNVAQPGGQVSQQPKERAVKSTPSVPPPAAHENKAMPPPAAKPPPPAQATKPGAKAKPEENKAKEKEHS